MAKAYQEKFIALKEHESINELELRAIRNEGKISDQLLWDIEEQKNDTVMNLKAEIVSLRKFANVRQKEVHEVRKNVALFYKKAKESQLAKEQELRKLYKDQVSGQVKILELELHKLQAMSQVTEQTTISVNMKAK